MKLFKFNWISSALFVMLKRVFEQEKQLQLSIKLIVVVILLLEKNNCTFFSFTVAETLIMILSLCHRPPFRLRCRMHWYLSFVKYLVVFRSTSRSRKKTDVFLKKNLFVKKSQRNTYTMNHDTFWSRHLSKNVSSKHYIVSILPKVVLINDYLLQKQSFNIIV